MVIVQGLRAVTKAVSALHRWFMRYSGTTMIIDNIEERRRFRRSGEHSEDDSDGRDRTDTDSEE